MSVHNTFVVRNILSIAPLVPSVVKQRSTKVFVFFYFLQFFFRYHIIFVQPFFLHVYGVTGIKTMNSFKNGINNFLFAVCSHNKNAFSPKKETNNPAKNLGAAGERLC